MKRTKFTYCAWHWCNADESLFDLTPHELAIFRLLVAEARKS